MNDISLQDGNLELRLATNEDLELLMAWRSNPEIYRFFSKQDGPLTWEEHRRFWTTRKDRLDFIIYFKGGHKLRRVGTVNVSGLSSEAPSIGVLVGEVSLWGKGIGSRSVKLLLQWLKKHGHEKVTASVSEDNISSQKLFESLGFEKKQGRPNTGGMVYVKNL